MRSIVRTARRVALVAVVAFPLGTIPVAAQQPGGAAEAPESVATRYGAALRGGDWHAVARLMHPTAVAQFRSLFTPIVAADSSGQAAQALFGVASAAEVAKLPDAEMFARLFGTLAEKQPGFREMMSGSTMTVIGHVAEGPDVAHVVYRLHMSMGGMSIDKTDVLSMRRTGQTWGVLLSADLQGLAAALRQRAGS